MQSATFSPEAGPVIDAGSVPAPGASTEAGPDAGLMVDVDLSILGQNEQRFAEYEAQIREEYRWVPGLIFKPKRAEILQRFLEP